MADPRGTPSLARRFAFAMARLGLDPGPAFQRARNLLLRPARHELADARAEIAGLREELAALRQQCAEAGRDSERQRRDLASMRSELAAAREEPAADSWRRLLLLEQLLGKPVPNPAALPSPPPLVSIVMATRNRGACLAEAIASVQAQAYPHWQLHIVDDGSRDNTRDVVAPFLADPRVHYQCIAHCGPSAARNHALRAARGEFIAYLDSDNLWFPGFLSDAVCALAADPGIDLAYGVLATEAHGGGSLRLVLEPFDRARLEQGNFIDLNVVVHRRSLYQAHGGFDEALARLVDWDLLLRYTAHAPARALPVLAARYCVRDAQRISDTVPAGPSLLAIRGRLDSPPLPARRPRVLYVLWHYPQLSETYVESEIRCLLRWGVEVAVWREVRASSPYEPLVPIHDGDLHAAVRSFQPDVLHVHWLGYALGQGESLGALGVPVTLRMHGFDVREAPFRQLLRNDWVHRVYAYPRQLALLDGPDPRVLAVPAAFDTSLFRPAAEKDTRLVVRTSACLPSKDLGLFFEVAKLLPSHRFVFCGVTCNEWEHYPEELRRMAADMASPAELRFDVPRDEIAALVGRAGIFLHTIHPPDAPFGAPIGMPMSIAEAMATGAYVLVRDLPEMLDYVGDAGASYRDAAQAAALIEATTRWTQTQWLHRRVRAADHGYVRHADELVLRAILADWQALAQRRSACADAGESAGVA